MQCEFILKSSRDSKTINEILRLKDCISSNICVEVSNTYHGITRTKTWCVGHLIAAFDKHLRCAHCRDKAQGSNPCVLKKACNFATQEQVTLLSTASHMFKKDKKSEKIVARLSLVNASYVFFLEQVDSGHTF